MGVIGLEVEDVEDSKISNDYIYIYIYCFLGGSNSSVAIVNF